jgi:hypothetical protein
LAPDHLLLAVTATLIGVIMLAGYHPSAMISKG